MTIATNNYNNSKVNKVIVVLDLMESEDREILLEALYDQNIDSTSIFEILNNNGWDVSYDQVRRFRNGACRVPDRYQRS
jgi:hypothetical protein